MRHESESHCSPTNIDIGMVILGFGVLADPANGIDTVEKRGEFDGPAQGAIGALPTVEVLRGVVHLVIGQYGHIPTVRPRPVTVTGMPTQIVVAGALISDGRVLVAQRARPPELAGLWELPGGKVAPGESDAEALARELQEELGVDVAVGERLGVDVMLSPTMTLRAYLVYLSAGQVRALDHRELRWIAGAELHALAWVPADTAWLPALASALAPS